MHQPQGDGKGDQRNERDECEPRQLRVGSQRTKKFLVLQGALHRLQIPPSPNVAEGFAIERQAEKQYGRGEDSLPLLRLGEDAFDGGLQQCHPRLNRVHP